MEKNDLNNYLSAINFKKGNIKKVELISSKRKQAWKKQNGKCALCKKELKTYFCKNIEDPKTKEVKIICSECAINIPKKK